MLKIHLRIWNDCFGNVESSKDCFGEKIKKSDYKKTDSKFGWDIDHVWPLANNGSNSYENKQILSIRANREKKNNLQGKIYEITFAVKKYQKSNGKNIGRMMIKKDNEWYWAYDDWK